MYELTQWGESCHSVYIYQIIPLCNLNILQLYLSIMLNKAGKNLKMKKRKDINEQKKDEIN